MYKTTDTFGIICVTNRALCEEDFLTRIGRLASAHPAAIVLREKDLNEADYYALAKQVLTICAQYHTTCILHNYADVAIRLAHPALHLPLPLLRELTPSEAAHFTTLGASCHSASDAAEAQRLGCTYITAGHIYDTDCKAGLPGRGITFLRDVCDAVSIPVYAIGGIDTTDQLQLQQLKDAGAAGACIMSRAMRASNI